MLLGESELKKVADRILAASTADQTEVLLFANDSALTRFANSYIHQNVEQEDADIRLRVVLGLSSGGAKIGVASTKRGKVREQKNGDGNHSHRQYPEQDSGGALQVRSEPRRYPPAADTPAEQCHRVV